ncbi:MAG: RHS repeat-associated core domain-containing protein [Longibaculum sp.]
MGHGYNGRRLYETGNIYLRARYSNPRIGQFVQIDSNRGTQEQINTQQRYTYCANNQYKYVTINGSFFLLIAGLVISLYAVGVAMLLNC